MHHPRFLPPAFTDLVVEQGRVGAGTVTRFRVTAGGRTRAYHMRVDQPEPGRVLTESDLDSSLVTSFTVIPTEGHFRVAIETGWQSAGGLGGFVERLFAPRLLRSLYDDELGRSDRYTRASAGGAPPHATGGLALSQLVGGPTRRDAAAALPWETATTRA